MKERPIIFSGESVRAILDGHKTQTRRAMNPQPFEYDGAFQWKGNNDYLWGAVSNSRKPINLCPYGKIGEHLWVRETWKAPSVLNKFPTIEICREQVMYDADKNKGGYRFYNAAKKRSALFMPRWASRITLEITNVRLERLQDITDDDAVAEGVMGDEGPYDQQSPVMCFETAWNKINGKRYPWGNNPFVWVIEFKKVEQ